MTSPIEPGTAVIGAYLGVSIAGTVTKSRPHTINHAAWLVSVELTDDARAAVVAAGYIDRAAVTCWVGFDGQPVAGSDGSWLGTGPRTLAPPAARRVRRTVEGFL